MDEDELQDQLDDDGATDGGDSGSDNSAPPESKPATPKESKRVDDLMGKWQREEARANRLQARIDELEGKPAQGSEDDGLGGDGSEARISEFEEFARQNARGQLFASDARLAAYGLSADDIEGSTLAEMRASMTKHLKLIDGIEGRARNRILAEVGLDPEVSTGSGTEHETKFSEMSDADFAKFLQERDSRPR